MQAIKLKNQTKMKRLFLYILIFTFVISCTKKDTSGNMPDEGENMVFDSYSFYPDSLPYPTSYKHGSGITLVSAKCYFFNAVDIKTSILKESIVIENIFEWPPKKSEVIATLVNEGKLKMSDGTLVNPINIKIRIYDNTQPYGFRFSPGTYAQTDKEKAQINYNISLSRNEFALIPGKYFVVAVCESSEGLSFGDMNLSPDGWEKYSGKFITITSDMAWEDRSILIIFPNDQEYKGYFEWIEPV